MEIPLIIIVIVGVILTIGVILFTTHQEGYYPRDIPFNLGFGGWPPHLYSQDDSWINRYSGYYPGVGLTW